MQSSAAIALPNGYADSNPPAITYDFSSQVAAEGDAICVGMVVYDGISGGKPTVKTMSVSPDGWAHGSGISTRTRGDFADNPIANATLDISGTDITVGATRGLVGVYSVPVDGIEAVHSGAYSEATILWDNGSLTGNMGTSIIYATDRFSAAFPGVVGPGFADEITVAEGDKSGAGAMPSEPDGVWLDGVRFPCGVPLYT